MTTQREIRNVADNSSRVVTLGAASTLDIQTHSGRLCYITADITITLPPATGSGAHFLLVSGKTSLALTVNADGTDVFKGNVFVNGDASADAAQGFTAATETAIVLNATTTGGLVVGDHFEIVDVASGIWWVRGMTSASGTEATPFAA